MEMRKVAGAAAAATVGAAAVAGLGLGVPRKQTIESIRKISDGNAPYNLYSMHVKYPYSIDRIIGRGLADDQKGLDAIMREAMPLCPVRIQAPDFGCSAFSVKTVGGSTLTGRNYDFRFNTSAMIVHCAPKGGYESIALCALDNLAANDPLASRRAQMACLAAPFTCLDGMNAKGVSISVLTLDSAPTRQATGKPVINTSMAIRLVLDRAATTQEAVDLLLGYDMFASCGRDYHFYINDMTGDGRVFEYDCESAGREAVAIPVRQVTNYFAIHADKVKPNQHNGVYGHGLERAQAISDLLDQVDAGGDAHELSWAALRAAAQEPDPGDITSNTQWSVVYDNMNRMAGIVLQRDWDNVYRVSSKGMAWKQTKFPGGK